MMRLLLVLTFFSSAFADKVIWSGNVEAKGAPSAFVLLDTTKEYKIVASGIVDLGKWEQQTYNLGVDSCYQFNQHVKPSYFGTLKNSLDIPVCQGQYHENHKYESSAFKPKAGGIHFWVYDLDYTDNSGAFQVEVVEIGK